MMPGPVLVAVVGSRLSLLLTCLLLLVVVVVVMRAEGAEGAGSLARPKKG